jgi:hypothetical protein
MSGLAAEHGDLRCEIDLLRLSVRLLLYEGTLPPIGSSRVGRGKGKPCVVCSAVISDGQLAYHVESDGGSVSVHVTCYLVWRHELEQNAQRRATIASTCS